MQTSSLRTVFILIIALLVANCGGGGGTSTSSCTPISSLFFYEVTQNLSCANSTSDTLKSFTDFSGSYGYADGGGGGGDGGGGGGGAGAGDALIRIVMHLKDIFYTALGIQTAYATAPSACGLGVAQSDLNKLTATGWQWQPLAKSTTASGTVCVNRLFDANKYIAVYATGLTKLDQTCFLVMVNKSSGKTHCFSSNEQPTLEDEYFLSSSGPGKNNADYMSPSLFESPSMSLTANNQYFAVMFHTSNAGASRQRFVRFDVSSDSTLPTKLIFDSQNLPASLISSNAKFQKQLLLNSGNGIVQYYINNNSSNNGYLYSVNDSNLTSPTEITHTYFNPQCLLQNPLSDDSFIGYFTKSTDNSQKFRKYDNGSFTDITNSLGSCTGGNTAFMRGKYLYSTQAAGTYDLNVYFIDTTDATATSRQINLDSDTTNLPVLGSGNTSTVRGPNSIRSSILSNTNVCSSSAITRLNVVLPSSDYAIDPNQGLAMFLDGNEVIHLAVRTLTSFQSNGNIDLASNNGKGLSKLVTFSHNSTNNSVSNIINHINFTDCLMIRKFEKGSSGNFAYLTEPFNLATTDSNFAQTTTILNNTFGSIAGLNPITKSGQNFKVGGVLSPL